MCKYVNLHHHTYMSLLDGYGSPESAVKRAAELNQTAIGITDHGNMSAIIEMKQSCEKYGVKMVPGSELYITPWGRDVRWRPDNKSRRGTSFHLTCWAYNQTGYRNLLKLTELSNRTGFYYVPRIDYNMLEQYNEGLIVTSGCMASATSRALNPENGVTASDYRQVNEIFGFMLDVFGEDRYYIELQDHDIPELRNINLELSKVNKHYGFEYIATNDSHYARPEDAEGQSDMMCVDAKCSKFNPNEFIQGYIDHPGYYLTDYEEMAFEKDYGFYVPESAFTNTVRVSEMVEDIFIGYEPEVKQYRFPIMPEYEDDYDEHLRRVAVEGLVYRYGQGGNQEALDRLIYELKVVADLGFSSYFLCVYDISQFCFKRSIPMTVRGSAGGSIILYCLGVSDFCPLEHNLIFERFMNPDRISAPDADLDLDQYRRPEVINYIIEKYGSDFVAQVVTFGKIKGRSAIRDATRLLNFGYDVGDAMIEKMSLNDPSVTFVDASSGDDFIQTEQESDIFAVASRIQGQVRSIGIHAAALMLSNRPLVEDYPLMRPKASSKAATELLVAVDYESAESLGGIKLDLLNVSALGILYDAIELINSRHGTEYRFENLPVDDPRSYELINSGRLAEIFQLTGHTARSVVKQIKPQTVEDIMAINAIARPGPLQYAQLFADRLHGKKEVEYLHNDLIPVLEETQGIMIYQEQVMRISQMVAGFTGGKADILRKAISKKKGFDKIKKDFLRGAASNGYDDLLSSRIWEDMLEFAGYGFNASHACAYSRVAVKMAYLKSKYPIEFYSASLTRRMDREDKFSQLLMELDDVGIKLLPPKVGLSKYDEFAIDDEVNGLGFPLSGVKNVGRASKHLVGVSSLKELEKFKKAGKRSLESLALVGALDHWFDSRNEAMYAVSYLSKGLPHIKQETFIDDDNDNYSRSEFLAFERELTGLYLTGHPLDDYHLVQPSFANNAIYEGMDKQYGVFFGVIHSIRLHRDKSGHLMAFIKIEDKKYDFMDIVIFSHLYDKVHEILRIGSVVKILGQISVRYGKTEDEDRIIKKYGRVSVLAKNITGDGKDE